MRPANFAALTPVVPFKKSLVAVAHALLACALLAAGSWAGPETLTFVKGTSETLQVFVDFDRQPEVPSESNRPWEEIEKDSVFTTGTGDEETLNVRFVNAFYAELDGRKGYGTDYIFYTGPPEPSADREPVFTAESHMVFPDGSSSDRVFNITVHLDDFPRLHPVYGDGADLGTTFGFEAADGTVTPVDLVARTAGWDEPVAARPWDGKGGRPGAAGWLVRLDGRQVLQVPEGRSKVRLIDVTGRPVWRAEGLRPGEVLALPADLGPGAFRYQWIP